MTLDRAARTGGRREPLQLLDDAPVLVDHACGNLGAADVNPDRQAHSPARLAALPLAQRDTTLSSWSCRIRPTGRGRRRARSPADRQASSRQGRGLRPPIRQTRRDSVPQLLPSPAAARVITAAPEPAPGLAARARPSRWSSSAALSARGSVPVQPRLKIESSALIASWTADATASPAPEAARRGPGPESRIRRAARQIGHHWHSGDSPTSGGISLVAVSQTSAALSAAAAAERPAHLAADLLAHVLGARPDQPALQVAEHVEAGRGLPLSLRTGPLRRLVAPGLLIH